MAIVKSRKSKENISLNTQNRLKAVRVRDIILDINHPRAEEYGNYDAIGTIFYSDINKIKNNANSKDELSATPLFSHLKYYPLINEIVLILNTNDKSIYSIKKSTTYYLPQVNMWGHPHHNALPTLEESPSDITRDYKNTEAGLVRKEKDGNTDITLGQYFQEQLNIKPLLPYEGDMILEGRFGNSIRFGSTNISDEISNPNGWSDLGNTGDPITIIRNGQSSNLDEKGWIPTTENINEDASSIYLTSNQRIQNFKQASPYIDSWNAEYIEPQTIEQALLNSSPTELNNVINNPNNILPSSNEDESVINSPKNPLLEKLGIDEIIDNPKAVNETEDLSNLPDQTIQKDTELELPSSYINPGSGENNSGGLDSEFDTSN
tara:strand:+ start:781 stop:1914 length:1134 start_codon:yes stop_codon:yes gene_type:complete